VESVSGALTKSLYSNEVEDGVYAFLHCKNQTSGVLSVNWSDETYRKMSTTLTLQGTNGKIICDANEMKLFFKGDPIPAGYEVGWNTRNISQFEQPINFYLRGEEYSMQLDYFVQSIIRGITGETNSFATASHTDKVISLIREKSSSTWKG
jgi:predicted dehydrogenase